MLDCFANEQVINDSVPEMDVDMSSLDESPPSLVVDDIGFIPWAFPPIFNFAFDDAEFASGYEPAVSSALADPSIPALTSDGFDVLDLSSKQITRDLNALHATLSASDPSYSQSFDLELAQSVFAPHTLRTFISAFFRLSHNYVPVVHMPSFGSEGTSPLLILGVALCGAIRSAPRDDALSAKSFLRIAEEYIFRQLMAVMATDPKPDRIVLETLQAALLIHQVHFLQNSVEARRRHRIRRLPALVSAVRRLGLLRTRHSANSSSAQFLADEACIRTATWITLADWHQCGMFHVLPLTTTAEMRCDLPCPHVLWDAKDLTDADIVLYRRQTRGAPHCLSSLKALTETLMGDRWTPTELTAFSCIAFTGLELEIFALSSVAISAHLMSMMPATAPSITRAISRWQELWEGQTTRADEDHVEMTAMARHCSEFGCLLQKVVDASVSGQKLPPYLDKVAHDSVDELYNLILEA
ncbi:fungal transcriptional regulatory protein [Purpureocillium lavendulum]|uniref:Fungal transcriptional regulatory protein n=1 Tax=Purpureocillium lavendulum TaxID=1247861 RepID=A0AB34FR67_9HYPO|nr:fungal transcriptional regulatory protein [Purpureocillium lavendulum]